MKYHLEQIELNSDEEEKNEIWPVTKASNCD